MQATAVQINLPDFVDVENASAEQMEKVRAYQKDSEEQGGLLTQAQANAVLGVSSGRCAQLVKAGTLESYEQFRQRLLTVGRTCGFPFCSDCFVYKLQISHSIISARGYSYGQGTPPLARKLRSCTRGSSHLEIWVKPPLDFTSIARSD